MYWIEMSRDDEHGGGDWGFTCSLWSPDVNRKGFHSAWWDNLLKVKVGDSVVHLRGKDENASFVGISTCASNGFQTDDRPPSPGEWGYAKKFNRVLLQDYVSLEPPVPLSEVFSLREQPLRDYFNANALRSKAEKRTLFYVLQSHGDKEKQLHCQNGAYLSELDYDLARVLFGSSAQSDSPSKQAIKTGQHATQVLARVGQDEFSQAVRKNFGGQCCFPGCGVTDKAFLVGSHIARWADAHELRGEISNGLCLCLMHDKAFELGLFTLNASCCVTLSLSAENLRWSQSDLLPYAGKPIKDSPIKPSLESLAQHWKRIKFEPKPTAHLAAAL